MSQPVEAQRKDENWFNSHSHDFYRPKGIEVDDVVYMPGVYETFMAADEHEIGGEG